MSGRLTAEQVREAIFNGSSYASYDGAQYYANGIDMQAIADELNTRAEMAVKDGRESRWHELFGTPERAARTLSEAKGLCNWCDVETCANAGGECRIYDYDALLEWMKGDAE